MVSNGSDKKFDNSTTVEKLWYITPPQKVPHSWLVYTLDFVLATLQGCVAAPEKVQRTTGWVIIGTIVRIGMGIAQALIILVAWIPILSSLLETTARVFSRNAAGFFLRACFWKAKLKHLGQDTIIDQSVEMWGAGSISIGSRCHIDTNVRLAAGELRHGQHGSIRIGNYVHIGPGVHIAGRGGVEIGSYVGIMANAHIYSASGAIEHPSDPGKLLSMSHMAPHEQQHVVEGPVFIDDYAFVGMMTRIMPGVCIGYGAVVHGNSELTRDVPPFANIGGVSCGRQIGWRKPRRRSPRLSEITRIEDGENALQIRELKDPNDWAAIEGVAELHFDAFQHGVTTQLGRSFVYGYYNAIIASERCSLWVAEINRRVVGFLGVTIDRHEFERANRAGKIRFLAGWRFCTFRLSPIAVLRALKKKRLSGNFIEKAELLSIVVSPRIRRSGLGKRFLTIWENKLRETSLPSYIVYTDNPEGLRFYEKYGGKCLFKFKLRGVWSACFLFKLPI